METNNAGFEIETCSRCAGSGSYSYCMTHGTKCFKCGGNGKVLTKRGAAARASYLASLEKPAAQVMAGDFIYYAPNALGACKWLKVLEVRDDALNPGTIIMTTKACLARVFAAGTIRSVASEAERLEKLAAAVAIQATLTKAGKPSKRAAAVAA